MSFNICSNVYFQSRNDVETDLFEYGLLQNYVTWMLYGKKFDVTGDEEFDFDELKQNNQLELDDVIGRN